MAYSFNQGDRPLDGYTVQRGVGKGGFGEVYHALSDGGKEVALKYLRENAQVELRGVAHCLNLKNPHLVTLYDVKQNDAGDWFVIMEYVDGPSLRDLLLDSPQGLCVQKAAFLFRELARGMAYLHDRGIVHRDLKPGNIFYEDGYVKIGDYGLSKAMTPSQHSGQTMSVGTVHYMAPEIGSGNYSRTIDIYALGVMLYEMLLGRVPYQGASMGEVLMKHLTAQPEVDELPAPFPDVIRKALAKDPQDRYATVTDMVKAVFAEGDLEKSVASFEPNSLSGVAARAAERIATGPMMDGLGTGSSNVGRLADETLQAPSPHSPTPLPKGRSAARNAAPVAAQDDSRAESNSALIVERLLPAIFVIVGAGAGAGFLGNGGHFSARYLLATIGYLVAIVGGVMVGAWFNSRRRHGVGSWTPRFMIAACVTVAMIPASLVATELFDSKTQNWAVALIAVALIGNWTARVYQGRRGDITWHLAFTAGFWAWLVGQVDLVVHINNAWGLGLTAAAASLALQGVASLWPLRKGEFIPEAARSNDGGEWDNWFWDDDDSGEEDEAESAAGELDDAATVVGERIRVSAGPETVVPSGKARRGAPPVMLHAAGKAPEVDPRLLRHPNARTAWAVVGSALMLGSVASFISCGAIRFSNDEENGVLCVGVGAALMGLYCMSRSFARRRAGLWRGVFRPALFTIGMGLSACLGITLGYQAFNEVEMFLMIMGVIAGGVVMVGVWFIPAPAFVPAPRPSDTTDEDERRRKLGKGLAISGGVVMAVAVGIVMPLIMIFVRESQWDEALPATLVPMGVTGIGLLVAGIINLANAGHEGKKREKLALPLQRSFTMPRRDEIGELVQRHFLMLGYRPATTGRLIWSFERGAWSSQFWQSDVRNYKTTVNIAAFESAGGYRVTCYVDVQLGWNTASQKQLRLFAEELDQLELLLNDDPESAYRSIAPRVEQNA